MIHDHPTDIHTRNLWQRVGSHERLAFRKQARCVPETWGRTYNVLPWSAQGRRKQDEKFDSHAAKKAAMKLVSSNCTKILE